MTYTATVGRRSTYMNGYRMLLKNIHTPTGAFRDHCWINICHRLETLSEGDIFTFSAKIESYISTEGAKQTLKKIRNVRKT